MGVDRCEGKGFNKATCEAFANQCDAQEGKDAFSLATADGKKLPAGPTLDACYSMSYFAAKAGKEPAVGGLPTKDAPREPEKKVAPVVELKTQEIKECKGVDASKIFQASEKCIDAVKRALGVQMEASACPMSVAEEEREPVKKQKVAEVSAQTNGGASKSMSREQFVIPVSLEADPLEVESLKGSKVRVTLEDLDQVEMSKEKFDELNAGCEQIRKDYDQKIYAAYLAWHAAPSAADGQAKGSLTVETSDGKHIDLQAKNAASAAAVKEIQRLLDERDRKFSIARKRMSRQIRAMVE